MTEGFIEKNLVEGLLICLMESTILTQLSSVGFISENFKTSYTLFREDFIFTEVILISQMVSKIKILLKLLTSFITWLSISSFAFVRYLCICKEAQNL